MPIEVLMPALSPTMEKGNLAKWIKHEGDKVKSGDVIAEIETDKATMEVEAVDEGTLGKILVPEGTEDVASTRRSPSSRRTVRTRPLSRPRPPAAPEQAPCAASVAKSPVAEMRAPAAAEAGKCRTSAASIARAGCAGRDRNGHYDGARRVTTPWLRRCGAIRRVRHGRGSCGISGCLQGDPGVVARVRRRPRCRHTDH